MGIVVHMEPLEHVGNRLYREVVLMDASYAFKSVLQQYVIYSHLTTKGF